MAYNTDLFDLIKSLTPSEKAYFKRYGYKKTVANKSEVQSSYLQLFDAIDKQDVYNESKLLKQFAKEKFTKNFSATKGYLYSMVLNSTVTYNEGKSNTDQILVLLREIELLTRKGLTNQGLKKIEIGLKKAQMNEQWSLFCYLLFEQLINSDFFSALNEMFFNSIVQKNMETTNLVRHDMEMAILLRTFHTKWRQLGTVARSEKQISEFHELMQHPFLQDENCALTNFSKLSYFNIHVLYQGFLNNTQEMHNYLIKGIRLFEDNPYLIEINLKDYLYFLDMQLGILMGLSRWKEFDVCIQKLGHLLDNESNKLKTEDAALYQSGYYILRLLRHYKTWDLEAALVFVEPIKSRHALFPLYKHIITGNLFFIARSYFMVGMFEQALSEINEALNIDEVINFSDYYAGLRILNLLTHLELRNEALLEYTLRSTYRFLQDRQRLFVIENLFLKFLKKLLNIQGKDKILVLYREFYENIQTAIDKDPKEIAPLRLFDFRFWLESKIKEIPMKELAKTYKNNFGSNISD